MRPIDPTRLLLGRPTSCIGRDAELEALEAAYTTCETRREARLLLVTGPAGGGKSRVRHELLRGLLAGPRPPAVLQSRGDPLRQSTSYVLAAQLVRQAVGVREGEPRARLRHQLRDHVSRRVKGSDAMQVTHFLGELLGAAFDDRCDLKLRAARADPAAMADQIAGAFAQLAQAWTLRRPVILVLEDVHWGDAASVDLLAGVVARLVGSPLFVLAVARPPLRERFLSLFEMGKAIEIDLAPLPAPASTTMVRDAMGDAAARKNVGRVVARSQGNAFLLEELIREAADRGDDSDPPAAPSRDDAQEGAVAVARARLERLDPAARAIVRGASVFGSVFWLEGVVAVCGQSPAAVEPIIGSLIEREVVVPSEQQRLEGVRELAFRHDLLQCAAYATSSEQERRIGHQRAAAWLEQLGEDAEVVAMHWLRGGERARAAETFFHAARFRSSRAQPEAAARCALRALALGEPSKDAAHVVGARVQRLAKALRVSRRIDQAEALDGLERDVAVEPGATLVRVALTRAIDGLGADAAPGVLAPILADAASALGTIADFSEARRLLDRAAAVAANDEQALRHVRCASARVAFLEGDFGSAWETLSQTLLPEDPRERFEMLLMLAAAVVSVHGRDALARGLDYVSRAETLLAGQEDPVARVHCAMARFKCYFLTGQYARGVEASERGVEMAKAAGLRFDECAHLCNLGEQLLLLGQRERAREALEKSEAIAREAGLAAVQPYNAILLAYLDGSADRLANIAGGTWAAEQPFRQLQALYWLGHLLASGAERGARVALERARAIAETIRARTMADDCARALERLDTRGASLGD